MRRNLQLWLSEALPYLQSYMVSANPSATPSGHRVSCASLPAPSVPGAVVVSMTSREVHNYTVDTGSGSISFCDVNVTLTHGGSMDTVLIETWMPLDIDAWNSRFQGTGGGSWTAGYFAQSLAGAVAAGYAAGSTDAGLSMEDGSEMVDNPQLLTNFASLSVHEMAIVGKALVHSFYSRPASYSYWSGCSTGGRQGMMEAQKYPEDFDGILAIAPAINLDRFIVADLSPYVAMLEAGEIVQPCVFDALDKHLVRACDLQDGVEDGLATDALNCRFNASSFVGEPTLCNGSSVGIITSRHANVYNKILGGFTAENGTKLWYGLLPGTQFYGPSVTGYEGLAQEPPMSLASFWTRVMVFGERNRTESSMTSRFLEDAFVNSQAKFGDIIGTSNPDLVKFRNRGGKILTWHGLSDEGIFPEGTFDYYKRVQAHMCEQGPVEDFYRVFSAPGVGHCFGGKGPQPHSELDLLTAWVEEGRAPVTLPASSTSGNATRTLNLCRYPLKQEYLGSGDINNADNWVCT